MKIDHQFYIVPGWGCGDLSFGSRMESSSSDADEIMWQDLNQSGLFVRHAQFIHRAYRDMLPGCTLYHHSVTVAGMMTA